ncbi:MAG: DUF1080 domain-containing protein [Verrucomicrobia bacterium]|nr:DUF1080 domain-containing protein [Verrucomicrobiota bacterium]
MYQIQNPKRSQPKKVSSLPIRFSDLFRISKFGFRISASALLLAVTLAAPAAERLPLFDGKTFTGWTGDTNKTWRIADGTLVGGSLEANVPRNEFLATERSFTNFVLRLKFKLTGKSGFINAGVQIRSQRASNPVNEMVGYQADLGDPKWWGSLYDESRRNKMLAESDMAKLNGVLKRGDWNDYEIRCEGRRLRLAINGTPTVDYTEPDETIPQFGRIGLQIHGGAVAEVSYKDITVEVLP